MWPFRKRIVIPEIKSITLPDLLAASSTLKAKWQDWNTETAIQLGYEASGIVFACIDRRQKAVASVPWIAERKVGNEWKADENSDLQLLIDRPNKDMSFSELMQYAVQFLDLAGNAMFTEIRAGNKGLPYELWPISPAGVEIISGFPESLIAAYKVPKAGSGKREVQGKDMIHLSYPNPGNFYFGLPLLKAAGKATDIDREAGIWQKISLENRGVSDIAIILDAATTPAQLDQIKKRYEERQAGASNARRPLYTNKDVKLLNQTAVELDFANSRYRVWEELCAVFGVPPPMIGLYEKATLANIQEARRIFWLDTVIPLLDLIMRQLNIQLAFEFGKEWRIRYDLSGVEALKESRSTKVTDAKGLWSMGVPFDVIDQALELGIGPFQGSDKGYLSAGLLPTDFEIPVSEGMSPELAAKLGYGPHDRK